MTDDISKDDFSKKKNLYKSELTFGELKVDERALQWYIEHSSLYKVQIKLDFKLSGKNYKITLFFGVIFLFFLIF